MGKQTEKIPLTDQQLKHLVANAACFFETAKRAATRLPVPNTDQLRSPLPAAVACLAFCAELLLKALIEIGGQTAPNEHNLNLLFARLDEASRRKVCEKYEVSTGQRADALEALIGEFGGVFVQWRYWHEAPERLSPLRFNELKNFVVSLAQVVSESGRVPDIDTEFVW